MNKIENIGKKDIAWSYAATIFKVGAGVFLFPIILHKLPVEVVGIWNIFLTISSLVMLLDFGFRPSFARNVSYILSGAQVLQVEGVEQVDKDAPINYSLLKSTLEAMRYFYKRMALVLFVLWSSLGTWYFYSILQKYGGDHTDALIAWVLLIGFNCYNLYTLYYDALLLGKGYVKRSQQITIIGQVLYLGLAIAFIYAGWGLTAIVASELISILVRRICMHRVFFTPSMKEHLAQAQESDSKTVLRIISPNAIKIGLTQLGGFCVNRSAILMGAAFLSLEQVACYGITFQVLYVLSQCGLVLYTTYMPKLAAARSEKNVMALRRYYGYCVLILVGVYVVGGVSWIALGDWALKIIGSQTSFVPIEMLVVMLGISLLEKNHSLAAGFIAADNKIPFFIPSLVSGAATIVLMYLFLGIFHWGLWGVILAPGIAQLAYQNWKWPSVVITELYQKKTA